MKKLQRSEWVCIVIFLVVLDILCLWSVDISVSALLTGGIVTNGFRVADPMISYHIGLYGSILSTVLLSFLLVHKVVKD